MRLAFLLYKYFPYGGMQRDFRRFVEEVQRRGHHCRLYYISWQGDGIPGAELRHVPVRAATNYRRNERFLDWVQRDLAADPVDGIIGFNKMPGLDVYYAADSCYLHKALNERGRLYRRGHRFRHFAAYEEAIRREYAHVEPALFRRGRAQILEAFLGRRRIYGTDHFHRRYEAVARRNLEGALGRLH